VLTDDASFGTPNAFTAAQVTLTTTAMRYKTLVLPFDAAVPAGFRAYNAASVNGSVVRLESAAGISAGEPVVISGEGTFELSESDVFVAATDDAPLTNGLLTGTYKRTVAPIGSYILQNHDDVIGFYHVVSMQPSVGAFRAWLNVPSSEVKAYTFTMDDATAVQTIDNGQATLDGRREGQRAIFNLAGQRVQEIQKGVNITNGKKVILK